jgi:hypothetical protein
MLAKPCSIVQNRSENLSQLKERGMDLDLEGDTAVEFDADAAKWSQHIIITFPRLPVFRAIFRGGRKLCPEGLAHIQ